MRPTPPASLGVIWPGTPTAPSHPSPELLPAPPSPLPPPFRCVNLEDQLLLRLPSALSSPADAAAALAAARYYLFGAGDLEGLLQVRQEGR